MARRMSSAKWIMVSGAALVTAAVAAAFFVIGVTEADKWASSLGFFVGAAALGVSIHSVLAARKPEGDPPAVQNSITGGTFFGPVQQGRDFHE